jgi:3-phosphoshikimate 1-carboxyvinyltransferase
MGVRIDGREGGRLPPLVVRGGAVHGIEYDLPVASAQVKAAVLLAGLAADRPSVVREPAPVRAHTEEMLADFGADVSVSADGAVVTIRPSALRPCDVAVPGDPSQAAYWVVAGCVVPDSDVMVEDVYVGRARAGFIDVLRRMGADITVVPRTATTADIRARFAPLHATTVGGAEVPGLIDEIPVLAVAAACADGTTEFTDASELIVKETNRVATMTAALGALGVGVEPRADGLSVRGGGSLHGGEVESSGDHRVAMAGAIAALVADAPTRVRGWDAVATSYPGFVDDLERLQR